MYNEEQNLNKEVYQVADKDDLFGIVSDYQNGEGVTPVRIKSINKILYVKRFNVEDINFLTEIRDKSKSELSDVDFNIMVLIRGICKENGEPIFSIKQDYEKIKRMDFKVFNELVACINQYNDISYEKKKKN